MKIKGLKKAVGDYQRANSGGNFSPWYGKLMFDTETGEIWTDTFYSIGHNEWKEYHNPAIINLGAEMWGEHLEINMRNVRAYIAENYMKEAVA